MARFEAARPIRPIDPIPPTSVRQWRDESPFAFHEFGDDAIGETQTVVDGDIVAVELFPESEWKAPEDEVVDEEGTVPSCARVNGVGA